MRHRTLALAAALLATAAAVPAFGHPPESPGRPGVPNETDCRDITGGSQGYQQLIQSISQDEHFPGSGDRDIYKSRQVTVRDKGVATAGLLLGASSCKDVEYTIEVYDQQNNVLASHTQFGDGSRGSETSFPVEVVVANHSSRSVWLRAFTSSDGVVHDVAPDPHLPAAGATAGDDGQPGGGATTSFK